MLIRDQSDRTPSLLSAGHLIVVWALTVILVLVFYVVLMPVGALLRVMGIDLIQRRPDRSQQSYWISHERSPDD